MPLFYNNFDKCYFPKFTHVHNLLLFFLLLLIRYMLSADTKEERIVWCNKMNRALANIRTWHADALRPASK